MPREQVLEEMSQSLNLAAVSPRATPVAEAGDPRATIIDQAVSMKADLIVMGTHGRRGFKRLLHPALSISRRCTAADAVHPEQKRTASLGLRLATSTRRGGARWPWMAGSRGSPTPSSTPFH
jgi:hypothetical protein